MASRVYTTAEVSTITGVPTQTLGYWAKQRILVPSVRESHGPGTRRLYDFEDLVQLRFICHLRHSKTKWTMRKIREAITKLRDVMNDPSPLKNAVVFGDRKTILALFKTEEGERILIDALSAGGQQVMTIVLETLKEETRHIVAEVVQEESVA